MIDLILCLVYSTLLFNYTRFHYAVRPMDSGIVVEDLLVHDVQEGWEFLWVIVKLMPSRILDQYDFQPT